MCARLCVVTSSRSLSAQYIHRSKAASDARTTHNSVMLPRGLHTRTHHDLDDVSDSCDQIHPPTRHVHMCGFKSINVGWRPLFHKIHDPVLFMSFVQVFACLFRQVDIFIILGLCTSYSRTKGRYSYEHQVISQQFSLPAKTYTR